MLHILLSLVYRTDEDYWMQLKVVSMCKIAKIESWYNKHSENVKVWNNESILWSTPKLSH